MCYAIIFTDNYLKYRFTYYYFKQKFPELLSYPENPRYCKHTLKFHTLYTFKETCLVLLCNKKKEAKLSFRKIGLVD